MSTGRSPANGTAETRTRSLLKSLSWRFFATGITGMVAYRVTGQASLAVSIGLFDTSVKLLAYYVHERAWLKVSGR